VVQFSGSTIAQAPYSDHYNKVIVHHHGMDQPLVSVIEPDFARFRGASSKKAGDAKKVVGTPKTKQPPAGLNR
jgi:hypothetical protein